MRSVRRNDGVPGSWNGQRAPQRPAASGYPSLTIHTQGRHALTRSKRSEPHHGQPHLYHRRPSSCRRTPSAPKSHFGRHCKRLYLDLLISGVGLVQWTISPHHSCTCTAPGRCCNMRPKSGGAFAVTCSQSLFARVSPGPCRGDLANRRHRAVFSLPRVVIGPRCPPGWT